MRTPKPRFLPEKRYNKKTGEPIILNVPVFLTFNAKGRLNYYTGIRVDIEKWNNESQRVDPNTVHNGVHASKINAKLARMEELVSNYVERCKLDRKSIDLKWIKTELDKQEKDLEPLEERPTARLREFFEPYLLNRKRQRLWSDGLIKHIEVIFNQIAPIAGDTIISDVDVSIIEKYRDYLIEKNARDVTVKSKISRLRWFFKWLIDNNHITGDNAASILKYDAKLNKMKDTEKAKINLAVALNEEELKAIESVALDDEFLDVVRDGFLFSCETALRYGDLQGLKKLDCSKSHIKILSNKDIAFINIPLTPKAKAILEKYKHSNSDFALPMPCLEVANRHIKTIAMLAGLNRVITDVYYQNGERKTKHNPLWKVISTKVARKTFVTQNIAKGVNPYAIMKITDHSDFKTMQVYLDVADDTVANEILKHNK
jgi:site-specific recombinase XerD